MTVSRGFTFIILLGKSGCGKGTQAELLQKRFGFKHISTGALLRERMQKNNFFGRNIRKILKRGGLIPTSIVFHMWLHVLESLKKDKKTKGVILEGSPRKLYEAWMLKEALDFYDLGNDVHALHVVISDKEAIHRLLKRGRPIDDQMKPIKNRLAWFKKEVMPVVAFYKKERVLSDINGEQSVENVQKEILRKLKKS